ncbi:MAG: S8 family serine peptidase, partial [Bacteroidota bacterium]
MRTFAPLLLTLMLALVFPDRLPARGDTADPSIPVAVAHRVVVKLRPGDGSAIDRGRNLLAPVAAEYGITSIATWLDPRLLQGNQDGMGRKRAADGLAASGLERIITIIYMSDIPPEMMAAKLRPIADVEYAEPVYPRFVSTIPNDPQISQQSYLDQIRAVQGWGIVNADSSIIIAIVDTGTDPTHPDLAAALWRNPGEIGTDALGRDMRSNGVDDDGDGFRDDWQGYDFGGKDGYTPDNDPSPGYWHGTHVAGIAGAIANNGIGIAGIGFGAKLMIVKIADDNPTSPTLTTGPDGILFAARHGAQIINCSWGGPGYSQAEQDLMDVVTRMGSCVIAAAGNEGEGRNSISYPASYRNVLSVGSVQRNDQHSSFSSYNIEVGISAPGDAIYSTVPRQTAQSGYMYSRGTSMSTPIISGAAALLLTKYPDLPPGQVIAILQSTVDTIDSLNPNYHDVLGTGRLNIERALTVGPAGEAASVLDYKVIESANPGIVEAGETIAFHLRVKNLLSPVTNMRVMLTAASGETPDIEQSIEEFGAMDSYEERESGDGYFRVTIPKAVPTDYKLRLYFVLMDGDRKIGLKIVELMVNPNYGTTAFNRTRITFTGNGRIGFNDFPSNLQGKGL